MGFHRKLPIKLHDHIIPNVNSAKILGVTFDTKLTFIPHSNRIRKEAKTRLNLFRMLAAGQYRASRQTLLQILNSWLLPKILYGIEIVSRQRENFEKRIAPIYHKAIRLSTGAFCTSPIHSLLCESGLLPFDYIITNRLTAAAGRILEKDIKAESFINRVNAQFHTLTNNQFPHISKLTGREGRPGYRQHPTIDWSLKDKLRAGNCSHIAGHHFTSLIQSKYQNHYHIFTDGSVLNESAVFGIFSSNNSCAIKLPDHTSIFSAEAIAMIVAAQEGICLNKPNIIFTDSASVLAALEHGNIRDPHIQLLDQLDNSPVITFCWIPGHKSPAHRYAAFVA
ncbi:uncharacterized protein LOC133392113 isoform X2 [Anopheles gambiae]|uniref:uncharacterized protein LOC133392113 isoform X2 n=1 Tax=Anopheles gambiae TaxID=7165 RepID=UPI002AC90C75|nr:uncharacterized protein LOC133392113 isoform X2 [Anopheles gambiae]